ncbi:hypothetical protein BO94DRAFT_616143 [Aspergillus sclerotioniger CBS 115572]|uniref:Uncharacterized protein n=1 Tax=Aspergillus sclerotioniger CBS 115572 TaxID=1450535 RepID=A0A317X9I5_9EURO|nr:hypothetical protein BO94DRAFT_616143 [Aspergillus sclerotioniger CBS 115572]PWY93230.1 hypothetical protein BO94DRAFT_616143 [Aspergillus sclerotioniger CBS 115572]
MSLSNDESSIPDIEIYSNEFAQQLTDRGIYPNEWSDPDGLVPAPPRNWDALNRMLSRRRASLTESSFSEADFTSFRHIAVNAWCKADIHVDILPIIWGKRDREPPFFLGRGGTFKNIAPFSSDWPLPVVRLDYYNGARQDDIELKVREKLHDKIIPWLGDKDQVPLAPNFFVELGDPSEPTTVCFRKACYAGAVGCRAMQALQSYRRDRTFYDHEAYTITGTYASGMLTLYAHHAIPHVPGVSSCRQSDYIMTQLGAWSMIHDAATFRQGATAFEMLLSGQERGCSN